MLKYIGKKSIDCNRDSLCASNGNILFNEADSG